MLNFKREKLDDFRKKIPSSVKLIDSMFTSKTYNNHTLSVAFS